MGGFQRNGIWPIKPCPVLNIISQGPRTPSDTESDTPKLAKTPMTTKSIRQAQGTFIVNMTIKKRKLLFKSQENLSTQHKVDDFIKAKLSQTLKEEKRKRSHGNK
jgi:hypothetical protein